MKKGKSETTRLAKNKGRIETRFADPGMTDVFLQNNHDGHLKVVIPRERFYGFKATFSRINSFVLNSIGNRSLTGNKRLGTSRQRMTDTHHSFFLRILRFVWLFLYPVNIGSSMNYGMWGTHSGSILLLHKTEASVCNVSLMKDAKVWQTETGNRGVKATAEDLPRLIIIIFFTLFTRNS